MSFIREWLRNLFIGILALIGTCIFMLIFMKIFYPDTVSFFLLMGQGGVQLFNGLKLWPIFILAVILSAMPRRRRKR